MRVTQGETVQFGRRIKWGVCLHVGQAAKADRPTDRFRDYVRADVCSRST